MQYYLIAGEASGDLHASNLMAAISELDGDAQFRCWGGDKMEVQGGVIVKHIRELAFMGFVEVALNIRSIFNNLAFCKSDLLAHRPDALILIDYPGFNLRIARFARENGIPVFYYISPQIWAWKQSRVYAIRRDVDAMLVILPFEQAFYKKFDVNVHFVGHPLLDAIEANKAATLSRRAFLRDHNLPDKPLVALLPGSRSQEIARMLSVMTDVAADFPNQHFVIAGMKAHAGPLYDAYLEQSNISIIYDKTYDLLPHAAAALVTSGTATLETALFGVPQVVCYKSSQLSYHIARHLIRVKYISLVNLIMDQPLVTELIQDACNAARLSSGLKCLLEDAVCRKKITDGYAALYHKLGGPGASRRAASEILNRLQNRR